MNEEMQGQNFWFLRSNLEWSNHNIRTRCFLVCVQNGEFHEDGGVTPRAVEKNFDMVGSKNIEQAV